jgi:hypothetical protein
MEGAESVLERPIHLHRPMTLEIFLHPPVDPYGARWEISVLSSDPSRVTSFVGKAAAGADGRWTGTDLAPGQYRLEVRSPDRGLWKIVDLEVEPGMPAVELTIPTIEVSGTVSWREPAAEPKMAFATQERAVRVRADLEDDLRFHAHLPSAGVWFPIISFDEGRRRLHLEPVDVEAPGPLELELEVPAGAIHGKVVDPHGRPAAQAWVRGRRVDTRGLPLETVADENGAFSFAAVREGAYFLRAGGAGWSDAHETVDVEREENAAVEVTLRLGEEHEIRGVVLSAGGPVVGARVAAVPLPVDPRTPARGGGSATTDLQGEFSFPTEAEPGPRTLLVLAPGHAATVFQLRGLPAEPLELWVASEGGTVALRSPAASVEQAMLSYQGAATFVALFRQWAQLRGGWTTGEGTLVLPQMAPGHYVVCPAWTGERTRQLHATGMVGGEGCAAGYLAPGGELVLDLE